MNGKSKDSIDLDPRIPDSQKGFVQDETGAVFLEFIIVLFAWMFILFGVLQIGLIAIGAYYVNYANFMALRTAAVQYEYVEYGWINNREFRNLCEAQAAKSLAPLEPKLWKTQAMLPELDRDLRRRLRFHYIPTEPYMSGGLEYDFYMVIPFANYVIAAFDRRPPVSQSNSRRVMRNFQFVSSRTFPTIKLRSHNTVSGTNSIPAMHKMLIQRRWRYDV